MANGDNGGKDVLAVFGAMILGVLLGGIAALLLAPKSGPELREDIGDAAHRAKERAVDMKEQVATKYDDLRAKVEDHLKEHAMDAAKATEHVTQEAQAQIEQA
ncbi:MAG TPA: hypothetical protein DEP45_08875 [Armatimonadetes bacterium]|nr:hypothetical protein [Armatimonadota bacterium]